MRQGECFGLVKPAPEAGSDEFSRSDERLGQDSLESDDGKRQGHGLRRAGTAGKEQEEGVRESLDPSKEPGRMKGEATSRRGEQVEAEFSAGGVWLNDATSLNSRYTRSGELIPA